MSLFNTVLRIQAVEMKAKKQELPVMLQNVLDKSTPEEIEQAEINILEAEATLNGLISNLRNENRSKFVEMEGEKK